MKKVLAVTGIRSEYDVIYPVLKELQENKNFDLKVVVTGAHLSDWHGFTLDKIRDDGFEIVDQIDYLLMTNRSTQRAKGVGLLIEGLTQTVERVEPDFLKTNEPAVQGLGHGAKHASAFLNVTDGFHLTCKQKWDR